MGLLPYPRRSLTQFAHLPASPPPFAAHSCRPLSPHSPPRPHPQPGISPSPCGLLYGSPRRLYLSLCTRSYDEQYTVLRVAHCTTGRSSTGVLKRRAYIIQQRSTDLHFAHTHSTHRRLCYGLKLRVDINYGGEKYGPEAWSKVPIRGRSDHCYHATPPYIIHVVKTRRRAVNRGGMVDSTVGRPIVTVRFNPFRTRTTTKAQTHSLSRSSRISSTRPPTNGPPLACPI